MKKILILLCVLVIFCFFTSITEAAEDFKPQHFFYDVPAGIYDLRGKAWNKTGMIILGTTLLTTFSIYQFAEPYQEGDKPWKSLGDDVDQAIDDYGGYFFYALPFMFFWGGLLESPQSEERRHTLAVTEELFESIILTTGSGLFFKEAIERDRPDGSGNHSLPSAHTALAFSLAGTLAWNYPWYVGASSITAASFIGFARVDSGVHFLSDVVAGAGLGLFWATAVHFFHDNLPKPSAQAQNMILPWSSDGELGLIWRRQF